MDKDLEVSYFLTHAEYKFIGELAERHASVAAILSKKIGFTGEQAVLRINFAECRIIQEVLTDELLERGLADGSDLDPIGRFIEDLRYKLIF